MNEVRSGAPSNGAAIPSLGEAKSSNGTPSKASGSTERQLRRMASIATDLVGTPEQEATRRSHLNRQEGIADSRSRAQRSERLLKLRVK